MAARHYSGADAPFLLDRARRAEGYEAWLAEQTLRAERADDRRRWAVMPKRIAVFVLQFLAGGVERCLARNPVAARWGTVR
jgi:hypothetical protein